MQVVAVNSESLTAAAYIKPQRKIKEVKIMNAYIDYSISKGCRVFMSKQAADYIRLLQAENYIHAVVYGDAIIKCLEV